MHSVDRILPTEKRCLKCHKTWKEDGECENCHLGPAPYATFPPVERIFDFPHKTHWKDQDIACEECHSDMRGVQNYPPLPTMAECLACHRDRQGPTHCEACHENVALLRPQDHTATWLRDHDVAALAADSDCQLCHTQFTCDNCHSGGTLSRDELTGMNPVPSYRPELFSSQPMLARNHDLNYVYTHGLDANTKARDCRLCHESPEFCSNCHQNETDPLRNKPDFHGGLDWGAVKYPQGTDFATLKGGGTHAAMARRDIEACQACHDLEGGDPICVDCHIDQDGILHTDPKTHETGYLHDTQGDWCTEPVSLCFVCHKPGSGKGDRFCGYCHP
jgi:hypothetical protein